MANEGTPFSLSIGPSLLAPMFGLMVTSGYFRLKKKETKEGGETERRDIRRREKLMDTSLSFTVLERRWNWLLPFGAFGAAEMQNRLLSKRILKQNDDRRNREN